MLLNTEHINFEFGKTRKKFLLSTNERKRARERERTLKVLNMAGCLHTKSLRVLGCVTDSILSPSTLSGEFGEDGSLVSWETRFKFGTEKAGASTLVLFKELFMVFLSIAVCF